MRFHNPFEMLVDTLAAKRRAKRAKRRQWHDWYAWFPVDCEVTGKVIWFETVSRRANLPNGLGDVYYSHRAKPAKG